MHIQKNHLEVIVLAADDAEITAENIANAADIPPYRVRAELKRIGLENPTRPDALAFIAKRSPSACILLANMFREKHEKHETLWRNMEAVSERMDVLERRAREAEKTATKALAKGSPSKLPNLKPSIYGDCVYLKELAEWAGVQLHILKERIDETPMLLDNEKVGYSELLPAEQSIILAKGANIIAQALNLEKAE